MIKGTIVLEDTTIGFDYIYEGNLVSYFVRDNLEYKEESFTVPARKFFSALAIAVHLDGMPDWKTDYEDAESIMGEIRWIP